MIEPHADLAAKIQQVISDHLQAEDGRGGFATGFFLVATTVDEDDTGWLYVTAESQTVQASMGMVQWAAGVLQFEQLRYLDDIAE